MSALDRPVGVRAIAVLRIAAGPLVLMHLSPFLEGARDGVAYSDGFYVPFADWYPELPKDLYFALLWVVAAAAVLLSLGLWTRMVAWVTALGVAYNVFLAQNHFHHNRAFLIILLVGLAVIPAGRVLSVDAWFARRRGEGPDPTGSSLLALGVWRFELAIVYLASGISKTLDPDWLGGVVTRMRVEQQPDLADRIPGAIHDLLLSDMLHSWIAPLIVGSEIFIGAGLVWHRTRLAALWVAVAFHAGIEIAAEVQVFSWAALAALVVWITPTSRDRRLLVPSQRWRGVVRVLDWTGRFQVEVGGGWVLHDRPRRDGGPVTRSGANAIWFLLTRLPLTFWFAAPGLLAGRAASDPEPQLMGAAAEPAVR